MLYGRFIEIQENLRRKKLHRTNHQGSNILRGSFSYQNKVNASIQFRTESQPQTLKDDFS